MAKSFDVVFEASCIAWRAIVQHGADKQAVDTWFALCEEALEEYQLLLKRREEANG